MSILNNCDVVAGYCECGSSESAHDAYSGHSYTDSGAYHTSLTIKQAEAFLDRVKPKPTTHHSINFAHYEAFDLAEESVAKDVAVFDKMMGRTARKPRRGNSPIPTPEAEVTLSTKEGEQALYTMDQMRDYAHAYYKARKNAGY